MKRILCLLAVLISVVSVSAQVITTPNVGLQLPPAGSTNWNLPLNYNFNLLDQLFGGLKTAGLKLAYQPILSTGTPSATCNANNKGQVDYDTTTTPWTEYVCDGISAWHQGGGGGGGGGGATFPTLPGIVFNTTSLASRNATFSDIVNLWSSCTSGYLKFSGTCDTPSPSSSGIPVPISTSSAGSGMLLVGDSTSIGGFIIVPGAPSNGSGAQQCPGPSNSNWGQTYLRDDVTPYQYFNCNKADSTYHGPETPKNGASQIIFTNYNQLSPKSNITGDYPYPGTRYSNSGGIINTGNAACLDVFNTQLYAWDGVSSPSGSQAFTTFLHCGIGDWYNWAHSLGWGTIANAPAEIGGFTTAAVMYAGTPVTGKIPAQSTTAVSTSGTWTNHDPTSTNIAVSGTWAIGSLSGSIVTATGAAQYYRVTDVTNPASIPSGTYVQTISGTTVTLSAAPTAALTGDTLKFLNPSAAPFMAGWAKCGTSGSTMDILTMPSTGYIFLAYEVDGTPGTSTAGIQIDGTSVGTISDGDAGAFATVHYTRGIYAKGFAIPTGAYQHDLKITVTSGTDICPVMVVTPTPSGWNGYSMPPVVLGIMPPFGDGYTGGFDQQISEAQLTTGKFLKSVGFNLMISDPWFQTFPESQFNQANNGSSLPFYEHHVGTYKSGLVGSYDASPHFNDAGSWLVGISHLQAAGRLPYTAPDVQTGPNGTILYTKTTRSAYADVDSTKVDIVGQSNVHQTGPQSVFTGGYQNAGRQVYAVGNPNAVTVVSSSSITGPGSPSFTATSLTIGNSLSVFMEGNTTITSCTGGESIVNKSIGTGNGQTVNVAVVKNLVGTSDTCTLSGTPATIAWQQLHNLNQITPIESLTAFNSFPAFGVWQPYTEKLFLTEPSDLIIGVANNTCTNVNGANPWLVPSALSTSLPGNSSGTQLHLWTGSLTQNLGNNYFKIDPGRGCVGLANYAVYGGLVAFRSAIANNQSGNLDEWYDENGVLTSWVAHDGSAGGALATGTAGSASTISAAMYAISTNVSDAYSVTLSPTISSYADGLVVRFLPSAANSTTTPTLNVNSLGAGTIVKQNNGALAANDLVTTNVAVVVRKGTTWQLQNPQTSSGGGGTTVSTFTCADTSLSPTTQTCTASPTLSSLTVNTCIAYTTTTANTGALTLNVSALGAKPVVKWLGTALAAGDMPANKSQTLCYDGTNWNAMTIGNAPTGGGGGGSTNNGLILLKSVTVSAASTLDLTSWQSSSYDHYLIVFDGVQTSASTSLGFQVSQDNGSTWDSTANHYKWNSTFNNASTVGANSSTIDTMFTIRPSANPTDNSGTYPGIGTLELFDDGVRTTSLRGKLAFKCSCDTLSTQDYGGWYFPTSTSAVNGIRVIPGTGTLTGTVRIYGYLASNSGSSIIAPTTVTVTAGTTADLSACFSSTYDSYHIFTDGVLVLNSGTNVTWGINFKTASGFDTGSNYWYVRGNGSSLSQQSSYTMSGFPGDQYSTGAIAGLDMWVSGVNSSTAWKNSTINWQGSVTNPGTTFASRVGLLYNNTAAITGMRIITTGTFTGKVTCQPQAQ